MPMYLEDAEMDARWHLSESDFFENLPTEKRDFLSVGKKRQFKKGECIFVAGDPGDYCYYMEKGSVKILRPTVLGKEPIFWVRKAGDLFGLAEVTNAKERLCTAQALTPCTVHQVHARDLEDLLARHHTISRKIISVLGRRVRYLCGQIENLTVSDVASRLTNLLVCLGYHRFATSACSQEPVKFTLELTQAEIAAMMGSCQQTISETLRKLEREGLIEVSKKEITILNPSEILDRTYH